MAASRRFRHGTLVAAALGLLWWAGGAVSADAPPAGGTAVQKTSRVARPVLGQAKGERCVADTDFMRRNHMNLLKHQRDDTVHRGERQAAYSLKACIECHASPTSGSVAAGPQDFCQSCHDYAAVKLDCFECHSSKPAGTSPHAPQSSQVPATSWQGLVTPLSRALARAEGAP